MQYWAVSFVVIYSINYSTNNFIIPTTLSSPYHYYDSRDINWVLQGLFQCTSSQSTCQLCHTVKWEINRNEVITGIIQFLGLPHCQHVTVSLNTSQHLSLHTDISDSDIRNICCEFYCLIHTKLSKAAIVIQWNNETAGC